MSRFPRALVVMASMCWSCLALPHTAWLEPVDCSDTACHRFRVVFGGHDGELAYPLEKVRTVSALGADSRRLDVRRRVRDDAMLIEVNGHPVMLLMHFDNGIYTRAADGRMINRPMSQVENAVSAVKALKYHKTIRAWTNVVTTAQGQLFEVVPVSKMPPRAGVPMEVRVPIDGEPAAGIGVGTDETAIQSTTGPDGIATFTPVAGSNRLWAGQRTRNTDNPDFTQLSIEYLLTFDAQ